MIPESPGEVNGDGDVDCCIDQGYVDHGIDEEDAIPGAGGTKGGR